MCRALKEKTSSLFDMREKGKPVKGLKERGDMIKMVNQKNVFFSNVLNGYE